MYRLDHIAYRVPSRDEAVDFFIKAFGYKFQAEFEIFFNDEKTDKAMCVALEPPEKVSKQMPWTITAGGLDLTEYHLAPEIFVSEGTPGSIVDKWVKRRGGFGGIHHLAYQVEDVEAQMKEWYNKGWGDFTSQQPMVCEGITQVFSKPNCTGVIFEFIKREHFGFCQTNVLELMKSTANLDANIP